MANFAGLTGALAALAALSAATSAPALAAPQAQPPAPASVEAKTPVKPEHLEIRPDPAVRRGVLPNGMRYMLMRNATPRSAVSLRLAVDVGSYEEAETERGFAHFVEHMAFRSTRGFPDGAVDRVFAPLGVAFGRDQNATTTLFSTVYQLDLPKADAVQLKAGFSWLRDVADGIIFTDDAVSHERGVVLAEMETRNSPMLMAQEAISAFQAGEQRSTRRSPIGLRATLEAADAAGLRRFHQAWYRPANTVVAVAGDMSLDEMETLVRDNFGSWTAKGAAPARAPRIQPTAKRDQDAFNVVGPALPTAISACRIHAGTPQGADDVARLRKTALTQIWQEVLNQRLTRRANVRDSGLLGAGMLANDAQDLGATCLFAVPTGESWPQALSTSRSEMTRFAAEGPTELETEKAVELIRARLRGAMLASNSRTSPELASGLAQREISGEVFTAPADALYAYDVAVEDVTPEDIKARFAADWAGSAPLLSMTSPKPVSREAMLAAWMQDGPALSANEHVAGAWAYGSFGKPGKVTQRKVIAEPGFTRLTFANGVALNFKASQLEPNRVQISLQFGAGRRSIADADYYAAELGGTLLVAGGLGRHTIDDIQALFPTNSSLEFELNMGPEDFVIRASTLADNLETQTPLMAAFMTDPGFDAMLDQRIPTSVDLIYNAFLTQPAAAVNAAVLEAVAPDSLNRMPPREVLASIRSADFARVLRPVLTGHPIEVTIVGDVDEASVVKLVSSTFGALPARTPPPSPAAEPRFLRYPESSPPLIRAWHDGPADKASGVIIWPLYVSTPERRREEYALKLLASVFDTALRRRIREELGKTYAPEVSTTGPDFGDQGALQVSIDAAPRDLETLIAEAKTIAARLKAGEITPQMLEDAREPLLAAAGARRQTNLWWVAAMGGSSHDNAALEETVGYEPLISALTVDDLKVAATRWLAREPIVGAAFPRPARAGAAQ